MGHRVSNHTDVGSGIDGDVERKRSAEQFAVEIGEVMSL